ncbi:MAG: FKBP-type peptidyl-prolyl cis-trans isomerase, partial [Spirochaetaceae bacterium]|nr:FKBP-type peptidyl-prolyl cis-trans isomerase [Spirochaetaceae bacterium]
AFNADQASWNERAQSILAAARRRTYEKRQADLALVAKLFPDAKPDAVGIFQTTLAIGTGPAIAKGALASVAYKGSLLDGTVFDAAGPDEAFEFQVGAGQVIRGWDRAVSTMKVGEKRLVVLPPEFAYGEKGAGGVIPPNAFLVFEIELLAVK